ncbi:MAG: amidohydrolase family protein [Rubripirellula sp.]
MLIDAHHHLWKYTTEEYGWIDESMSVIQKDFLSAELEQVAAASGVDGFVTVQARQTIEETEDLLHIASGQPLIRGVVGWVPLAAPDVDESLDRFEGNSVLKGVRHVVQGEPDDRFIMGDDFNRGVSRLAARGLVYDVLIFAKQLPATIEFADRHPNLSLVLDHIAKPTIKPDEFDKTWANHIRELAKRDHVTCKFSGVVTEVRADQWSIETVRPYWDVALEAFGADRLMFGSDWPVCLLKTDHKRWLETVQMLAKDLSADQQAAIFAGNAVRAYGLS